MNPCPDTSPTIGKRRERLAIALAALVVAVCVTAPPSSVSPAPTPGVSGAPAAPGTPAAPAPPPRPQAPPTTSVNPASKINLQGFPLPYRQGYVDGCASAGALEQKDATRFKSDGQYRTGWSDGLAMCTKR